MKAYAFKSNYKLNKPREFTQVFECQKRRKWRSDGFLVFAIPNNGSTARLGISLAKKTVNSAVRRNLIKRILRETFRKLRFKLPLFNFVVVVKSSFDKLMRKDITRAATAIWKHFAC